MKLTTRGHYSVKAMLDLSLQPRLASVKLIAQRQNLPAPYLEKLLIQLRQAGLVESVRGSRGGYRLAKAPSHIYLGQILDAVGEPITPLELASPEKAEDWVTLTLWRKLQEKLRETLYKISLEELYYDARSWQAAQGEDTNFMV
ncbi:Rrf2 family transcriptional regulator [Leptolyngbyaceae cyanobacterium CCMR0082]|uniref:Rrf2 family transcriptional regulator n=2 Tax=Adonisia turfae TaxID=2950184 RepID=A0A6M0SC68_9CYAN|nr:Rrf2 family transcriptional regulator [Adonisia turfae]EKV00760.1 rrf2 family protein, putative transcriptional regulator [Leptolyngbya sp. PCC 7375]MDV3352926.1 Rrf2 family transcriptional regulator [Leptothoe sp. LEGE 181152]NEZ57256.1 Rrf2 family transcriptional regulator [Adonisia turfae CCMR0081]NEZ66070.1 Rrf2 family transcriptional regulator [Adonisia turfae CCMR0082]